MKRGPGRIVWSRGQRSRRAVMNGQRRRSRAVANPKVKKRYGTKRNPEAAADEVVAARPDEIEEGLVGLWEWVRKYRFVIIGSLVGLLVIALIGQLIVSRSQSATKELAQQFNEAIGLYSAPVIAPSEEQPDLPKDATSFPSEEKRLEAVKAKLSEFASAHGDGTLGELAKVALAAAQFQSGDFAGAESASQAYVSAHADSPLVLALKLQRAYALNAIGKGQDAAAALADWGNQQDWWFQAWAALAAGDMASDDASAKAAWEKGLAALGEGEPTLPAAKFVKSELERRIALAKP